jgi:hypothetical protein
MLLISILATESLSETEGRTKLVASLKSRSKRCPLTGRATFAEALSAIFASDDLADRIYGIAVDRTHEATWAVFAFGKNPKQAASPKNVQESEFGEYPKNTLGLRLTTNLGLAYEDIPELIRGD